MLARPLACPDCALQTQLRAFSLTSLKLVSGNGWLASYCRIYPTGQSNHTFSQISFVVFSILPTPKIKNSRKFIKSIEDQSQTERDRNYVKIQDLLAGVWGLVRQLKGVWCQAWQMEFEPQTETQEWLLPLVLHGTHGTIVCMHLCLLRIESRQNCLFGGWKDGPLVKSTHFSSRGPRFGSHHTHQTVQNPAIPVSAIWSVLWSPRAHTHTQCK